MGQQDLHVADVRRLAVEEVMPDRRAAQLFTDTGKLRQTQTESAMLFRQVRRPEAERFHFVTFGVEGWSQFAKGTAKEISFERINFGAQKILDPVQ